MSVKPLEFMEYITDYTDKKESVDLILCYFSKAFDKADEKVRQRRISGVLHRWIKEWLKNRRQYALLNCYKSSWMENGKVWCSTGFCIWTTIVPIYRISVKNLNVIFISLQMILPFCKE